MMPLLISLTLSSPMLTEGATFSKDHICQRQGGKDLSLPLNWSGAPKGTESFAITLLDPTAGNFVHWIIFNISKETNRLEEGKIPLGVLQGVNHFQRLGYGGPCPPPGKPHKYIFTLYALDKTLDLTNGVTLDEFQQAIQGHVLGKGSLTGFFES